MQTPQLAWANGVLFEREDSQLLAQILSNGTEIELRACGPGAKYLLTAISDDLDSLNSTFPGLEDKVSKWIPCICSVCSESVLPEFYAHYRLLQRVRDGKLKIECPVSYADVSVTKLLDGLEPDISAKQEAGHEVVQASAIRKIRIFLASSGELLDHRDEFDLYCRQQGDRLINVGIYLTVDRWEHGLDAMSETRLQDEYNEKVRNCDIFVSLFRTKTGKYTEEAFDAARKQFLENGRPKIYTYFHNSEEAISDLDQDDLQSLWRFQKRLDDLGHFYNRYDDIEHLKRLFREQLDILLASDKLS